MGRRPAGEAGQRLERVALALGAAASAAAAVMPAAAAAAAKASAVARRAAWEGQTVE